MGNSSSQPDGMIAQNQLEIQVFTFWEVIVGFDLHTSQSQIQRERQEPFTPVVIGSDPLDWISLMTPFQEQRSPSSVFTPPMDRSTLPASRR